MTTAVNQSANTNIKPDGASASDLPPHDVGLIFVREYYTFLNKKPQRLHAFYNKDSQFVRGTESVSTEPCVGSEAIRKKIDELGYEDCKVLVTQVDSQGSAGAGILVQVLGAMCSRDEPAQKFSQTFFLARQPNGYYVLNDIFRFLKDEDSGDTEEEVEESEIEQHQLQPSQKPQEPSPVVKQAEIVVPEPMETEQPLEPSTDVSAAVTSTALVSVDTEKEKEDEKEIATVTEEVLVPVTMNGVATEHTKAEPVSQELVKTPENQQAESEPKTWAKLAANASEKWSAQAAEIKAAAAPAVPAQNKLSPVQNKTSPVQTNRNPEPQVRQQSTQVNKEPRKEDITEIFIKNVLPSLSEDQVREAFSQFGEIKSLTVLGSKKCAILEFTTNEAVQKALSQHKVEIGEIVTLAEERHTKRRVFGRQQHNGPPLESRRPDGNRRRGGGGPRGGHRYRGGGGGGGGSSGGKSGEQK
ncbi:hypothetical protein DFQ28_008197 [Apophysomyces sp. BC1034]|nr:hypothetical protein DFQ30_007731 [Apophysomyces sp. BC1015]KAG0175958.1 hypothetical protein DFQ29_006731 [Apophysomyces sp. BC1021]KAG0186193.1 hypothetical protein DFQ28_008197 [Apophysomyces sp. BC1034]